MAIAFSNPYFLPADESPLDPIPKNGIDDIKYGRQISHESSSAPQSTSHSLSSLASSSDSDGSSSSEGSAFLSTTTEGSYDGHTGKVHVKRKRKISPKKKQKQYVFPQKVPLSPSSFQACQVIEKHVKHSGDSQDKDYVSSLNSILREWFELSSQENSEVEHVQGYLMSLADVSKAVLKKIINMADGNGNTALHYSISHGNFLIVNALLESGVCEVNKPNKAGATAIMLTALASIQEERDWRTVEKLFTNGDVNIRASQAGQTALMLAVSRGKVRMVQLLLQAGADVNVQDEDGSTALMCASEHGHLDIVKLLIAQQGCDININDNQGIKNGASSIFTIFSLARLLR
ncbi:KN motif and ankyrin repeat domain-containing protein 1 [Apostichopus japonicus]|uniref:KN motif and ankyrin repeat domain-containing protein 1 n=1 Tax=Stichopus japonicus TaxID=307972 RepID=A0A2G8K6B9_STIJA|nr:KN motif and ankyrin repeat domain-containing protein 1 [Apostichopus japonicus]